MRTKIILFVIAVAVVTLSFTFGTATKHSAKESASTATNTVDSQPVGGLYADDVIE